MILHDVDRRGIHHQIDFRGSSQKREERKQEGSVFHAQHALALAVLQSEPVDLHLDVSKQRELQMSELKFAVQILVGRIDHLRAVFVDVHYHRDDDDRR